ncbi:hypothetical protein V6260_12215 [Pseudoalteromonas aliena]|uniref:hypothetical protein n=1 Tax=Pseudoalteromonas aliena TaxID=247523 RepID=UPI00311E80B6
MPILKQLNNIDTAVQNTMGIEDGIATVLDVLVVKSASIARLESLINNLSWLVSELVTSINLPCSRKLC